MSLFIINKELKVYDINELMLTYKSYIKFVVDIEQSIVAAGTVMHYECEKFLLENGSKQTNLWGGGIDCITKTIDYNSLINIRPDSNKSMEVLDTSIRVKIDLIIKKYFKKILENE